MNIPAEGKFLIKFSANWCAPCKAIAPTVKAVVNVYDDVELLEVDVDEEKDLSANYGVRAIPTLVLVKNGQESGRLVGACSAEEIRKLLSSE